MQQFNIPLTFLRNIALHFSDEERGIDVEQSWVQQSSINGVKILRTLCHTPKQNLKGTKNASSVIVK